MKAFQDSCSNDPIVKDGFLQKISPENIRPVYLPFLVYDLKVLADLSVETEDADGQSCNHNGHFDLDLNDLPELLHDLPVNVSPGKYERKDSWLDEWKLIQAQPFRRAWLCGIRDKYGTASPPEVLDVQKTPEFEVIRDRILHMCVRQVVKNEDFSQIMHQNIGIKLRSVRYILFPVWLLSVTVRGKTYLSAMNASNRSNIYLSVPRSRFKRVVIAIAFGAYGTGLFALASILLTAPVPPAPYSWIIIPIYFANFLKIGNF